MIQSAAAVLNLRMKTHPALYEASFTDKREHVHADHCYARYSVFDFSSVVRFSCTHSGVNDCEIILGACAVLDGSDCPALFYAQPTSTE